MPKFLTINIQIKTNTNVYPCANGSTHIINSLTNVPMDTYNQPTNSYENISIGMILKDIYEEFSHIAYVFP